MALQGGRWEEADTDSDSGGGRGSSSSSGAGSPQASLAWAPADGVSGAGRWPDALDAKGQGLSGEEFTRLQDELLALKMHNQELLAERRRLQVPGAGAAGGGFGPSSTSTRSGVSAAAFGQKLSSQMKVSMQGVASLQSTLAKKGGLLVDSGTSVNKGIGQQVEDELEALRIEADALRSRIRDAMEQADDFQSVARDAQEVADAAEREQSYRSVALLPPAAAQLRLRVAQLDPDGDEKEHLSLLGDQLLGRIIAIAVRQENHRRRRQQGEDDDDFGLGEDGAVRPAQDGAATALENDAGGSDGEPPSGEGDDYQRALQGKVEAQQQELDRLLEIFHKQQGQVNQLEAKLKDKLSGKEDERNRQMKKQLREKLKEAERQAEGLSKQLEASEEESRRSQELRAQLKALAAEEESREYLVTECKAALQRQAAESLLLREQLGLSQEDLYSQVERRAAKRRRARPPPPLPPAPAPPPPVTPAQGSACPSVALAVEHGGGGVEAAVQAALLPDEDLAALAERRRLRTELEDLRIEKGLLEKRAERELNELREVLRKRFEPSRSVQQRRASNQPGRGYGHGALRLEATAAATVEPSIERSGTTSEAPATSGSATLPPPLGPLSVATDAAVVAEALAANVVEHHDISSDGDDEMMVAGEEGNDSDVQCPAGLVYVQQVAELEQQNEFLRQDLEMLHESEHNLRQEHKEKNELIALLLRKANLPETFGADQARKGPFWRGGAEQGAEELERTIEETTQDNIRLRNDIRTMADEFRKVLQAPDK